jgi:hypothetical protein
MAYDSLKISFVLVFPEPQKCPTDFLTNSCKNQHKANSKAGLILAVTDP